MTDSVRTTQDDSTPSAERPTWRFSGRRGTPVHLREQAPQTLPPEIRKAVTQLARERAGEPTAATDAKPTRAVSDLKLSRPGGQAPPVAAAPMPVERRNRQQSEPIVPTSHIPAASVPGTETEQLAVAPIDDPSDVTAVDVAAVDVPTVDVPAAPTTVEPEPERAAAPTAAANDGGDTAVEPAATSAAEPTAPPEPAKPTAAERKKLAKARAKARAKAERATKKDAEGAAAAEKARRLFARGREVDAAAAAEVEPSVVAPDAPAAESAMAAPVEPAAEVAAPLPPEVGDLPDVIPSLDAIDETVPHSFPAPEPVAAADADAPGDTELAVPASLVDVDLGAAVVDRPAIEDTEPADVAALATSDPVLATENASQAAWELGRRPFLVTDPAPVTPDPAPERSVSVWEVEPAKIARRPAQAATPAALEPTPAALEPTPRPMFDPRTEPEPVPIRATLQPIDWLPVGAQPTPAPIEPLDMPRRPAPEAIQRLSAPLEAQRVDRSPPRAGAREGLTPNARTAESRRRISRRRAELDELVSSLPGAGSGRGNA